MDFLARIEGLVITGGWALLWFVAVGMAIWQILRGRTLAGVALGAGAVVGLGTLVAGRPLGALFSSLGATLGYEIAGILSHLTFGVLHALALALLVVAAVLNRPPKVTDG